MIFQIGLENNPTGRSQAWVLDFPGCFAYGADGESALAAVPPAILNYIDWLELHSGESWLQPDDIRLRVAETFEDYDIDANYERVPGGEYTVEPFFLHDWKPLTGEDIQRASQLLAWSREDLLAAVEGLTREDLDVKRPGERWSIAGILRHVGSAEWWYLERLGMAFPREQLPAEPFDRLQSVRAHLAAALPGLEGSQQVVGRDGELWSPRKLLRRAIWHELDHVVHISRLVVSAQDNAV